MNDARNHEMVREATKGRFRGNTRLYGKTVPRFPSSAEREFRRVIRTYLGMFHAELKKELPGLMLAYQRELRSDSRFDDARNFRRITEDAYLRIMGGLDKKLETFDLRDRTAAISRMTRNTAQREWRLAVRQTLGIDLMEDYYNGDFYEEYLRKWVDQNVLKIKSIPSESLDGMRQIIEDGYLNGVPVREIQRQIQEQYNTTKEKANLLARDQVATLNSQISQAQQRDAGVKKYKWDDSHDSRVRECHAALRGQEFSWDDPPEMWYSTKSRGIVYTGRRCHPGEDYCCRCVAIPIFESDTINVPMKGE